VKYQPSGTSALIQAPNVFSDQVPSQTSNAMVSATGAINAMPCKNHRHNLPSSFLHLAESHA
jgi:hypothetical protein